MELTDLVGEHVLSGVDRGSALDEYEFQYCDTVTFILDGVAYRALEDPDDGYRSSMREISVVDTSAVFNTFPGQAVIAKMRPDNTYYVRHNVLELFDAQTGKLVLAVGTENHTDYYPLWVAEFTPENMAINAGKENRDEKE